MNIRFYNARILPMEKADATVIEGELWVENGRIAYLGDPGKTEKPAFDREIDCRGNLLLPGFKNAHTHSAMTFLRSFADDKPLHNWLHEDVFPMEAHLTGDDIYALTKLAVLEYLSGGTTAAFDMYYHVDRIAECARDTGFRFVICGAANDYGGTAESTRRDYEALNAFDPLVSCRLGFHAEYTTNESLLKDLAALAEELKAPVFTHLAETRAEVDDCVNRTGMSPIAYLDSLGMFRYGGGGFHMVHLLDGDLEIIKKRGLYVCTNPSSNVKLSSGVAPVETYYREGVPVAIGTDGPASNNCLDMFREMFLVTGLQKLTVGADAADPVKVLHSACSVGANMMGLDDCDCLAVGKQADIVMLDMHMPNMQPINSVAKNVVYSGSKANVALTMVAGRILYERGRYTFDVDPEAVYAKANEIITRIRIMEGR
ncbi:MAG: amidohydrolase [Clostridia bacterium]|nr:amidohydrolase [Clostridia bacterium]